MKKINGLRIILVSLFAGIVILVACKKSFLIQTNAFRSTPEQTFLKSSDVVSLVNSIYDTYQNSDLLKKSIWYCANFQSHDWFNFGGDVVWNNYTIPATFDALQALWNNAYIGIGRANSALSIIADARDRGVVTPALADRLIGEAYFLRGMTYYYLAASFGGVPLEIDTLLTKPTDGLKLRSSQDSVFMQVVLDMKRAEVFLQSKTTLPSIELGRATKGAAYAYEGAAQMWLKNYTAALAAFNNPELTNNYHLLPKFVDVHEFNRQNNDESLFEVQFDLPAPGASQSWDGSWQPPGGELAWIDGFSWPQEITNEGYDYGNPGLWASYQSGDLRRTATIIGPGDTLVSPGIIAARGGIKGYGKVQSRFTSGDAHFAGADGKVINSCGKLTDPWYGQDQTTRTGYYCAKKWRDPNVTGSAGGAIFGSQNQILLRYAEVLLSRAECKIRTGDAAGGLADIKLVRDRAWGGTAPAVMRDSAKWDGTPGDIITDPLQMVLSEYRHELTAEYSLFYDLRRSGTDVVIDFISKTYGTKVGSFDPIPNPAPGPTRDGKVHGLYNTALDANHVVLPIPQRQRELNPNLTQNPGY